MSAPPFPPGPDLQWVELFDATATPEDIDRLVDAAVAETMETIAETLRREFTERMEAAIARRCKEWEPMIRAKTRELFQVELKRLRH